MNARVFACFALLSLVFLGCSGSTGDPNRPKTVPVSGTVTHNGQPVDGAAIILVATSPNGRGATGTTDAQGKITLTTFDPGDGAIPGSYKVRISKTVLEGAPTEEESAAYVARGEQPPSGTLKDYLPAKYKDENTSGLTADIAEGAELKFDLTD